MNYDQLRINYIPLLKDIKFMTLCLFTFFLGYEYWKEAYIFSGFTITRSIGLLYFLLSIIFFKKSFSINNVNRLQVFYIFVFSWILVLSSLNAYIIYASEFNFFTILFHLQFFIFYWLVVNELRTSIYKRNLLFVFFILGIFSIYVLIINGIGLQSSKQGDELESIDNFRRLWFMGMNPNMLGGLTSLASILLIYMSLSSKISYLSKITLLLLQIPLIHMISISGSLGSLFSITIGFIILVFLNKNIIFSRNVFLILLGLFFLYLKTINVESSFLLDKLNSFLYSGNTSGRTEIWRTNYNAVGNSIILGLGLNSGLRTSHNVFLDIFVWTGVLGLITYILFMFSIFKVSVLNFFKNKSTLELAIFSALLIILLKSGGGFEIKYIWLFLATISIPYLNHNK